MVLVEVPLRELDQVEGEGTVDSMQGTALYAELVDNKGRRILVTNSRDTLVNHTCNLGPPRQEVQTTCSGLPDIQKLDTDSKRFV